MAIPTAPTPLSTVTFPPLIVDFQGVPPFALICLWILSKNGFMEGFLEFLTMSIKFFA